MTVHDLRPLTGRPELAAALRFQFPHLPASDVALSPTRGGRAAALATLAAIEPRSYERTRNFLAGDVTRLSAYLRHGVLTLAEVRDHALRQVDNPDHAAKFINELAWRDYWQRLYVQLGDRISQDRENYKTGYKASDYGTELPPEIANASTTLACIDAFSHVLTETGYLHNHARMWLASFLVHWRRVKWQAGAQWFLQHLIDGDPASNNLSWQWVASTFASKPYIFNRENLERYTASKYCRTCVHADDRTCPFEQDYEALQQTLFPRLHIRPDQTDMPAAPHPFVRVATQAADDKPSPPARGKPLVWLHTDSLNPEADILRKCIGQPAVFVWDTEWLIQSHISLKRIVFLAECLQEMPALVELRQGDPATEILAAAKASGVDYILAQWTPDPRLRAAALTVERLCPVVWQDPPPFVTGTRAFDLKRFSRYWQRAQASAMRPTQTPWLYSISTPQTRISRLGEKVSR